MNIISYQMVPFLIAAAGHIMVYMCCISTLLHTYNTVHTTNIVPFLIAGHKEQTQGRFTGTVQLSIYIQQGTYYEYPGPNGPFSHSWSHLGINTIHVLYVYITPYI